MYDTQLNHDLIEKIISIIEWVGIILKFVISTSLITLFFIYTGLLFYIKNKMMVVFDLTRPINIIIKKHKKIILSSTLLVIYLFIWFTWGVIYRDIANVSHGEEFIFQSDLLLKSQISTFKENTKSEVDNQFISDIITSKDYKNVEIVSILNASNDSPIFNTPFCKTVIGDKWANYYENMYVKKGVIGYSVSNIKKVVKDNTTSYVMNLILYTDVPETSEFDYGNETFKVSGTAHVISINGESPHIGYLDKKKTLKSVEEEVINIRINTTDSSLIEAFGNIEQSNNYILNIDLKDILKYSEIYLNKDIIELQNILKGEHQYSLADFLYFSAISITTTGYGDILPNSSRVRVYVMFEILFGVTVVGIFVSSLFIKEETN
ncbi:potassium channel family protein [Clostridium diolis]|uniref:potassium channel family protein n=1 Tax=Clostridium diolis TaxID=223919 RepID=UPI00142EDA1E|nr:potassium channel family protein [Clostridium diolis]